MKTVLLESMDGISHVYLNRPERYNAMDKEMLTELENVLDQVEQNDDKVVILSGKGKAFSAGGDIGMMTDLASEKYYQEVMEKIEAIVLTLYSMPKIIISAIHGSAAGLGLSLALTADYVAAHQEAKLGMLFIGIGLAPDGGGHFWLRERIGTQRAKQFIWDRQQVWGTEAKTMGLVDVLAENEVTEQASQMAGQILDSPITSMLKTKMIYHDSKIEKLKYYLQRERQTQWELLKTKDHWEGVQAFQEKRQPVFKGE
ncbi:Enoyl-CoA hydratase/carnithine racemase [Lentibacillus halodurans]|uniref:Enoyl-CoA hydratase/carnithine racemase n=1 Tax=Lentibacillus halodurans TaxID=237679 RepID=A0A1I0VYY5_9BACI|nr:enoyl-CoA hydratase [Lentibacillus halodurans]SFA81257.1 Enoyl-CoA hydratase/carnithine racemase [Lentibacillus halodurans]